MVTLIEGCPPEGDPPWAEEMRSGKLELGVIILLYPKKFIEKSGKNGIIELLWGWDFESIFLGELKSILSVDYEKFINKNWQNKKYSGERWALVRAKTY